MSQKPTMSTLKQHPETHRILRRVYRELLGDAKQKIPTSSNRAFRLTGLNENTIEAIRKGDAIDLSYKPIDRAVIHNRIYDFLMTNFNLPTARQLFRALKNDLPAHMDIEGFRKLLYNMDYVYFKLTSNKFVILERPEITYERVMFLKDILDYDKTHPMYFVEEWIVPMNTDSTYPNTDPNAETFSGTERIIFAFSKTDLLFRNSFLPKSGAEIHYKNWIVEELLPTLEKKSVIVVNTDNYYIDLFEYPTIDSLKVDMKNWLDRYEVPYNSDMTKIELFTLIEKYTDIVGKKTTLDDLIHAHGHIPMRIPRHLHMLTPGKYLFDHIKEETDFFGVELLQEDVRTKIDSQMNSVSHMVTLQYIEECMCKYSTLMESEITFDEKLDIKITGTYNNPNEEAERSDRDSDINLDSD